MIVASKGAAGVTGAGLATLAAGLQSHRHELVDGVGLIVGIDRFMSEARALTNFTGNAVATVVIGKWTGEFDADRAERVFSGQDPFDERTMVDDGRNRTRSGWPIGTRRRLHPESSAARAADAQAARHLLAEVAGRLRLSGRRARKRLTALGRSRRLHMGPGATGPAPGVHPLGRTGELCQACARFASVLVCLTGLAQRGGFRCVQRRFPLSA